MFHRGWFLISVPSEGLAGQIVELVRHYGVARMQPLDATAIEMVREPGRFAGVFCCVTRDDLAVLDRLQLAAPSLPVLALLVTPDYGLINMLQARGIEVALLPVHTPNVVSFAQRALAKCFLPSERVSRVVAHLASTQKLTAREVQLVTFCLGNEPRARVRRRLGITENTLKTQIKALLRKCNERSVDALAKNILRAALIGNEPLQTTEPVAPWLPLANSA